MATVADIEIQSAPTRAPTRVWVGRILSGLAIAFLLFDAGFKLAAPELAIKYSPPDLGWPPDAPDGLQRGFSVSKHVRWEVVDHRLEPQRRDRHALAGPVAHEAPHVVLHDRLRHGPVERGHRGVERERLRRVSHRRPIPDDDRRRVRGRAVRHRRRR